MERVLTSLGKTVLYFLVFLGSQMVVTIGASIFLMADCVGANGELDIDKHTQLINDNTYIITMTFGLVALLVYWFITWFQKKSMTEEILMNQMIPVGIVPSFLMGFSLNFIVMLIMALIPFSETMRENYSESSSLLSQSVGIMAWLAVVFIGPIVEEIAFRGFIYNTLKEGIGIVPAAIITSLAFGIMHGTFIWAVYTFVMSLLLIFVFERFNSLWASIVFHIGFNFFNMAIKTWSSVYSSINPFVLIIGSVVVFVLSLIWILKLTKYEY